MNVVQIANVRHARPWMPGMDALLPPGTKVEVVGRAAAAGGLLVARIGNDEDRAWPWIVHHTSLIPLACEPARVPSPVL